MNKEKQSYKLISQLKGIFTPSASPNNIQGSGTNTNGAPIKKVKRKRTPNWMYRNE